ncbi:MAG: sulfite exporter TauE/SafE family protein [Candidatus Cyclobacteriaceae bacterium M2_1C_046]
MSIESLLILSVIFLIISILYSSAGFGGGSSYLAFLALFGVNFLLMKSIALLCNIVVVSGNLFVFSKRGLIDLKQFLPLALVSVPMAFAGGFYDLKAAVFFVILGIALLAAGILLIAKPKVQAKKFNKNKQPLAIGSAAGIGFLSGLVGIGGGIFLSPVLNIIGWDNAKKIAATASFFILVNSISGFTGHFIRTTPGEELWPVLPLIGVVFIGGQIGSRVTTYKLKQHHVKVATAVLVLIAGLKILFDHL